MSALAATAAMAVASRSAAADPAALPILDTHQHLWDLKKFTLPWLAGNERLGRSFLTADYVEAARGLNIERAVYMEVDVAPAQQQAEAEHVIGLCQNGQAPTVAAVISGRPASDGFAAYIKPLAASPYIKGVRQVLHGPSTPPEYCLDPAFVRGIRLLGELGLRYDLCMRPEDLGNAIKLVDLCPGTRFVLDHCGNIDPNLFAGGVAEEGVRRREQWRRDIAALSQRTNLVCKISGIVARAKPGAWGPEDLAPAINHCLDAFGPERVVFGSDWPVCTAAATLSQWVAALKQIVASRPQRDQRRLFHDNALKFYRLA
jgi:predicted TIM-barrel fold metal-dependent hydrolase